MAEVKSSTPRYMPFGKFLSLVLLGFERFSSSLTINLVAGFLSVCMLVKSEMYSHMAVLYPEPCLLIQGFRPCFLEVGPASMIVGNLVAGKRIAQASGRELAHLEDSDQARKVTASGQCLGKRGRSLPGKAVD